MEGRERFLKIQEYGYLWQLPTIPFIQSENTETKKVEFLWCKVNSKSTIQVWHLQKTRNFLLRISSVNVTKFGHIY